MTKELPSSRELVINADNTYVLREPNVFGAWIMSNKIMENKR